jgi:adenylate cyclase
LTTDEKPPDIAPHDPYSPAELAKHIDHIFYDALRILQFERLTRKQITVVFWDVSGFSTMCKKLYNFEDSINYFLRIYFEKAIEIIEKHHGVLDKFMGDGILAYFGYDRTVNGDPFSAIDAALEFNKQFPTIKKQLNQYCENSNKKKVGRIDLKCGIDNGPAFFHYFNTPTRNSVIVLGSTLNLASRLEGKARNNQIIVSEELGDMIQENYKLRKMKIPEKDKIKSFKEVDFVYVLKGKREVG